MAGLGAETARLKLRVAELERRLDTMLRHGPVKEVDAEKGLYRQIVGKNNAGEDVLSPWVPYGQVAGKLKMHAPPSEGQNMTLFSPTGDMSQAVGLPFTWNNANESPSKSADENVLTFGDVKVTLVEGGVRFEVGGFVMELTGSGLGMAGGSVAHDGKNIGATHTHPGVQRGGAKTDPPEAGGPTP